MWKNIPDKKVVLTKSGRKSRITPRITLLAPMKKLVKKIVTRKFVKWNPSGNKMIPTAVKWLQNLDHADIVKYYNACIRGTVNFYSFADNRSSLGTLVRYLHISCARTLALKYKLRFMAKVYKKFGKLLTCPDTGIKLYKPDSLSRIREFNESKALTLEMLERTWANKITRSVGLVHRTRSNLGHACIICGDPQSQIHHVKKLYELRRRLHLTWWEQQFAAINRKQLPLCADHHKRLPKNMLSPAEQ